MARHPFRLQTVARLRESHRDTQRQRFAEALRAEGLLREQRKGVDHEIDALSDERREAVRVGVIDPAKLLAVQRYEFTLRAQQRKIDDDVAKIAEETERRRLALVEAEREVRTLEKLKQRDEEKQRKEEERREALSLDEFASQQDAADRREQRREES